MLNELLVGEANVTIRGRFEQLARNHQRTVAREPSAFTHHVMTVAFPEPDRATVRECLVDDLQLIHDAQPGSGMPEGTRTLIDGEIGTSEITTTLVRDEIGWKITVRNNTESCRACATASSSPPDRRARAKARPATTIDLPSTPSPFDDADERRKNHDRRLEGHRGVRSRAQGHDYAYTVGLHDRDRPELFLWARPTDGDDPGADWMLCGTDLAGQLNEFGTRLLDGSLAPGDSTDVAYDRGSTKASMILRQPVAAHGGELGAFQTAPDATISEIRWSLHQRPIGPRRELEPDEVDSARDRLSAFLSVDGAAPVDFPATAELGPLTPLLHALRLRTRSLDDHRAERLLAVTMLPQLPESEIGEITQAARAAGLVDEAEEAFAGATVDARALADRVFGDDPDLATQVTNLFATIFSVAYGTELVRHELPGPPPPCSEIVWALLDPDGARTQRFVDRVAAADPELGRVLDDPDLERLASIVQDLDDETLANLASLWVHAAAAGQGSGIWLMALLLDSSIPHETQWFAGVALATAGNIALDVAIPGELGRGFVKTVRRVIDGVREVEPLRRAS